MTASVQPHEGEVAARLDLANLLTVTTELEVLELGLGVVLLARPLKGLGPRLVAEPVADVVSITSVDKDWNLLKDTRNEAVVWLHPVTLQQEVAVDVEVAAVVGVDLCANGLHDLLLVEVRGDPVNLVIAEVVVTAGSADVVDVLASALIRANHGVVAVDGGGHTAPNRLGSVAVLNEAGAARVGIVHGLALALVKNSRPATLAAGHGAVVLILSQAIGETVTNQHRLEVDVALLVGQNLRCKDGDVMTSIGFTRDVEALFRVLGELLEEKGKQGVDVLAGSNRVADRAAAVGVTDIDGLVDEDDRSIGVPREVVELHLAILLDRRRSKLHEETHQGRATRTAIEP